MKQILILNIVRWYLGYISFEIEGECVEKLINRFIKEIPEEFSQKIEEIRDFEYKSVSENEISEVISEIEEAGKFGFKFLLDGEDFVESKPIVLGIKIKDKPISLFQKIGEIVQKRNEEFYQLEKTV